MIIKDNTFFTRLKSFLINVQVNDLPSREEKEYFLKICEEMIVCKTALRIQTVKHAEFKMPDDFLQIEFIENLKLLIDNL